MPNSVQPSSPCAVDPDPIAIVTICIAGVGMLSAVANTILQIIETGRRGRDEQRKNSETHAETHAEILIARDRLISAGHYLENAIDAFRRDANLALSFRTRPNDVGTFQFGSYPAVLMGSTSRQMWDLLIEDVCNNVKQANRIAIDYNDQLNNLFVKLSSIASKDVERAGMLRREYIETLSNYAREFQEALNTLQSANAKTPLPRVLKTLDTACARVTSLVHIIEHISNRIELE